MTDNQRLGIKNGTQAMPSDAARCRKKAAPSSVLGAGPAPFNS